MSENQVKRTDGSKVQYSWSEIIFGALKVGVAVFIVLGAARTYGRVGNNYTSELIPHSCDPTGKVGCNASE